MEPGETYFKLYRKIFDNGLWMNPVAFRLFIWILGNAVYSKKGVELGTLTVQRGQYLRSFRKLREDLSFVYNKQIKHYSLSSLHRAADLLIGLEIISKRGTELGTLFTVINYDKYQPLLKNIEQSAPLTLVENSELGTEPGTTREQQRNNTNKVNKVDRIYSQNSDEFRLASLLFELIKERNPNHKPPNLQTWVKHINYMIRIDNRNPEEVEQVIRWCQHDSFWMNNILSTNKLREKFDQLVLKMNENGRDMSNQTQSPYTTKQFNNRSINEN